MARVKETNGYSMCRAVFESMEDAAHARGKPDDLKNEM